MYISLLQHFNKMQYIFICLLLFTYTELALAANNTTQILRLETGMHTSQITKIDVDAANRYLVTGSLDKTARIWSVKTGELLQVLRPPINKGNEGKIYAVAFSPDGKTVAVGGWTGTFRQGMSIYLFDRATGELKQGIRSLPNVIHHLTYSPNGRFLVATLGGRNGIRIYRTSNYRLQSKDTHYRNGSHWAAFDRDGRLVTTSYDGYIRLYNQLFKLESKIKLQDGKRPFAANFSPSGQKIAVGFEDATYVNVLSGNNLKLLYRPNTRRVNNGNLANVAWSADGRWLYAGGKFTQSRGSVILRWSKAGKGRSSKIPASANTIMDIRSLRNGSVIFATSQPSFGLFTAKGNKREYGSKIADFRGIFKGKFLVSKQGDIVQFGYKLKGKRAAEFDINQRILALNPSAKSDLNAPRISRLNISDWKNSPYPKLNGKRLALKRNETAHSLAITSDAKHFLIGADWSLRFFNRRGSLKWKVSVPAIVWGVNIAANNKVAIAAIGDGTIRWYRLRDGRELLALFPHKDGKRWILWTPKGYYAASSGAEEFIGWHINNGFNKAADFFPAARFRENYYRPELIAKILETLEPKNQAKPPKIKKQLPPIVTLLSPQNNTSFSKSRVKLRYKVRNPSNVPITGAKILIDGRPLERTKGFVVVQNQQERANKVKYLTITLPKRDVEVALIVENRNAASEPAIIKLQWKGKYSSEKKPKLYVLAIGVSKYDNPNIRLRYAAKDARDLAKAWKAQRGKGLYSNVTIKLLADATQEEVLKGLKWIQDKTTQNDVAIVSLSGHGTNDNGEYYFLPRDVNIYQLKQTAVSYQKIKNTVSSLLGKALFFVDTCHSGNVMGDRVSSTHRGLSRVNTPDVVQISNDLSSAENGVVVFASSTGAQYSLENSRWKNGAFTEALIEALNGKADYTRDGVISINELDLYLSERVKKLTRGKQTPTTTKPKTIEDFMVAKSKSRFF